MIKKTVTYEDFNGETISEDLYFHLSKVELVNLELSHEGGLSSILPAMLKEGNMGEVVRLFNSMIRHAYGKRSDDGRRFIKDEKMTEEFMTSPAFDALFTDLISSPESAATFMQGVIPKDLMALVEAEMANETAADGESDTRPPWIREDREPTTKELTTMTHQQLLEVMQRQAKHVPTPVSQPKQVL